MTMHTQKDNSRLQVKLELRRRLLRRFLSDRTGPKKRPLAVLDACAAEGVLWKHLKTEFDVSAYLPIDKHPRLSGTIKMDNRQALRALDLEPYSVFDIDTYGEPWEQLRILSDRLARFPVCIFLTHGHPSTGGGAVSHYARDCLGIPREWPIPQGPEIAKISASYCLTRGCEKFTLQYSLQYLSPNVDYYGLIITDKKD